MTRNLITAALCALFCSVGSYATTLTFDTIADCATSEVNITAGAAAGACALTNSPDGSLGLVKSGPTDSFWTATFSSTVEFVSVELGDFNSDADRIFLSVFDTGSGLLGTTTFDLAASFVGMQTLSLSGLGPIGSAVFGTTGEIGNGGIIADNLTFRASTSDVPEPSTLLLLTSCLLGAGAVRRRYRKI